MRKKSLIWVFITVLLANVATLALAQHNTMIRKLDYLNDELTVVGMNGFPPFSDYRQKNNNILLQSAFIKPLNEAIVGRSMRLNMQEFTIYDKQDINNLALAVQIGKYNIYIGAYADTKRFKNLTLIYPAVISNPIHVITLPEKSEKIKDVESLKKLRGVVVDSEFYNDFSSRKIEELNVKHVENPLVAYELLFTEQIDYIIGGLYYHRIMASRQGLDSFLSYSKKPLFKIPVFLALSKSTPKFAMYLKAFQEAFSQPKFVKSVKEEILRMIEEELAANEGIVPPSFANAQRMEVETKGEDTEKAPVQLETDNKSNAQQFEEILEGL